MIARFDTGSVILVSLGIGLIRSDWVHSRRAAAGLRASAGEVTASS
ncbi:MULTISPECIES: hypothetical protein [Actinosynnema]